METMKTNYDIEIIKELEKEYGSLKEVPKNHPPEVLSQELPVIPNYVAKWISVHHERFDLYPALKRLENNALSWEDVYEWYRRNTHTFVNAYLTGKYEVEEEQKYNVKVKVKSSFGTVGIFLYKEGDEVLAGDNFRVYYPKEEEYMLTEQEIRGFQNGDVLFEHFAKPVEELEE